MKETIVEEKGFFGSSQIAIYCWKKSEECNIKTTAVVGKLKEAGMLTNRKNTERQEQ